MSSRTTEVFDPAPPFALGLSKGSPAEGWFDSLTMNRES